jgi:glycosyltransferase involved in cell wall biosynthesis
MQRNGSKLRRHRITHITLGLDTGGQEKLLLEFARHADRRRFELYFLSLTTRGRLAAEIEQQGWPVVALEEPPGFRPSIAMRIAVWLRRWRVDVVHTHDSRPLIYGAPAARMVGAGRIVHMRHFARLPSISRRQTWLAKLAARCVDDYVCVSQESARAAAQEGVPADRVRTVWNGVDLERFGCSGPDPKGGAAVVARLSPEKDIGTLVRAVALAVRECPDFHLEIAGSGPCLTELRQLVRELDVEAHVAFLGEVRDIAALLAKARFFVLSSLTEGISLTLLEAMACGLPVVATRVGGNPEVVLEGVTGLLVPPSDPAALARAMIALHRDLVRSQKLGIAGRDRVERHFAVRRMVTAYETTYKHPAPTVSNPWMLPTCTSWINR